MIVNVIDDFYDYEDGPVELSDLTPEQQHEIEAAWNGEVHQNRSASLVSWRSALAHEEQLNAFKFPAVTEEFKSEWITAAADDGMVEFEDVEYATDPDNKGKPIYATMFVPQCKPPAAGFPSVIIVPGRSNRRLRHFFQGLSLSRRGIITMTVDIKNRLREIIAAVNFMKLSEKYRSDPAKVFLAGYSLGAVTVLNHNQNAKFSNTVAGHITMAGIFCDAEFSKVNPTASPLLAIEALDDTFIRPNRGKRFEKMCKQYMTEGINKPWDFVPKWLSDMNQQTGHAYLLPYRTGGHQPLFNGDIHAEIEKFIKGPSDYKPPIEEWQTGSIFHIGSVPSKWKRVHTKGCTHPSTTTLAEAKEKSEGFMAAGNFWSGTKLFIGCFTQCKHTKGCIGVDVFDKFSNALERKYNCALFSKVCEEGTNPKSQFFTWEGYEGPSGDGGCTEID